MSWSVSFIGKPENVAAAIEKYGEQLSGQSLIEFEDAKPHLIALVEQNFVKEGFSYTQSLLKFSASGSGTVIDGEQGQRNCSVEMTPFYGNLV